MWQPQFGTIPGTGRDRRNRSGFDSDFAPPMRPGVSWGLGTLIIAVFSAVWFVVTLPFRLILGIISLLGRMAGVVIGFSLMVVGVALIAGPFFFIGLPLFLVGLFLTLRSLG